MIQLDITGIAATGFLSGLLIGGLGVFLMRRVRTAQKTSTQFITRFMYSGNLKQTNLLDAIQFLEIGRREGILHLYIGRRKGYVTFVGVYRNITGKEAIFQMIELDYGDFYFESKVINQPRVIKESIMDIAMEWDARKYGDMPSHLDGRLADGNAPPAEVAADDRQTEPAEMEKKPEQQ